ncbi:phosphotransferase [Serinicoccus profundi]|uniref:phosphotransferase n=1 Tax=Serinicoccus profundi TaxID=1078471 RepID=UPI0011CAE153|nr:phosphotransferase [Serinicoccus profundi]
MPTAYADLDEASQVEVLREVALLAAPAFGLHAAAAELVLHGFNTTFRLDTHAGAVAMRVNTNSMSSIANVEAQQAWQHALRRDTDVIVPDPLPAAEGGYVALVHSAALDREVVVTASSWLAGEDLGTLSTPEQARALGALAARLHTHAEQWEPEGHGRFPRFASTLFGDPDLLTAAVAGDDGLRDLVTEAWERCERVFARWAAQPAIPLHADLHGGNLKWHEGTSPSSTSTTAGSASPRWTSRSARSTCAAARTRGCSRTPSGRGMPRSARSRTSPGRTTRPWWRATTGCATW